MLIVFVASVFGEVSAYMCCARALFFFFAFTAEEAALWYIERR